MKTLLQLLFLFGISLFSTVLYGQENAQTNTDQSYPLFRSQNLFSIKSLNDPKIMSYVQLDVIEYVNPETSEKINYTSEEFISLLNEGKINHSFVQVKRARTGETWYKLGNTSFVLIGYSEEQVTTKYNLTIKK